MTFLDMRPGLIGFFLSLPGLCLAAPPDSGELLEDINHVRKERGLEPLSPDGQLLQLAQEWAEHLARTGRMNHRDDLTTLQKQHGYRYLNENIYRSSGPSTGERILSAWMKSPGHRKNLLKATATHGAVGIGVSSTGSTHVVFHAAEN